MPEAHDVAPAIDDALFRAVHESDAPVNVPLVLARHVAGLPPSQGPSLAAANRLREVVAQLRERKQAAVVWDPTARWRGHAAGTLKYFFQEEQILVYAKAALDTSRSTCSFLLDSQAAVLFQGTLNVFLHYLNPLMIEQVEQAPYLEPGTRPAVVNKALIALTGWAQGKLKGGSRRIRLFAASCSDRYGQAGILEGVWQVTPPYIAWGWKSQERTLHGYLNVEMATWVSGLITLLRMTYPEQWRWRGGLLSDSQGGA